MSATQTWPTYLINPKHNKHCRSDNEHKPKNVYFFKICLPYLPFLLLLFILYESYANFVYTHFYINAYPTRSTLLVHAYFDDISGYICTSTLCKGNVEHPSLFYYFISWDIETAFNSLILHRVPRQHFFIDFKMFHLFVQVFLKI